MFDHPTDRFDPNPFGKTRFVPALAATARLIFNFVTPGLGACPLPPWPKLTVFIQPLRKNAICACPQRDQGSQKVWVLMPRLKKKPGSNNFWRTFSYQISLGQVQFACQVPIVVGVVVGVGIVFYVFFLFFLFAIPISSI